MIGLVFAQLAARWGQALTLFVLSVAATVAAVSVPAFAVAIDQAAVDNERATADSSEFVVSVSTLSTQPPAPEDEGTTEGSEDLTAYADARSMLGGFIPLTTVQIQVQGLNRAQPSGEAYSLLARDGFCRYVTFSAGRCPVGNREAALPAGLAKEMRLHAGDQVVLTPVRRTQESLEPDGPPVAITFVGVFKPKDPDASYWVPQDPLGRLDLPKLFTNRTTVETLVHGHETVWIDAILPPQLLTPERIPRLRDQLAAAEHRLTQEDAFSAGPLTSLPSLLDRIDKHGELARALLPIAAAPLIALCWFVIHLAVGHGMWGRRLEVGAVVLRGAKWPTRAVTVAAESLLPLLAGVPVGLVLTGPLVGWTGPGDGSAVGIDRAQLLAAALAAGGTVLAGLLALRRELAGPVGRLLRQVAPRSRRIAVAAMEVLAIALGIVVVIELRSLDGELVGVMVAAPVLIILAVAMLASLAVRPLLDLLGRWTLRRGRIGPAVAALYLARRPAASVRLLVVLVLVFGTLGFAATATDVAAQGRKAEAQQLLGAARVLEVQPVGRQEFLRAVRTADPSERHAMAVVPARTTGDDPALLAVDSTRLANVALWSERYGATGLQQAATVLRPPARKPTVLRDGELTATLRPDPFTKDKTLTVSLQLVSQAGDRVIASFGPVTADQRTYRAEVRGCVGQCRLTSVTATSTDEDVDRFGVTFGSLTQAGRPVMTTQQLADDSRWRPPEGSLVTEQLWSNGTADGLLLSQPSPWPDEEYELLAARRAVSPARGHRRPDPRQAAGQHRLPTDQVCPEGQPAGPARTRRERCVGRSGVRRAAHPGARQRRLPAGLAERGRAGRGGRQAARRGPGDHRRPYGREHPELDRQVRCRHGVAVLPARRRGDGSRRARRAGPHRRGRPAYVEPGHAGAASTRDKGTYDHDRRPLVVRRHRGDQCRDGRACRRRRMVRGRWAAAGRRGRLAADDLATMVVRPGVGDPGRGRTGRSGRGRRVVAAAGHSRTRGGEWLMGLAVACRRVVHIYRVEGSVTWWRCPVSTCR